MLLVYIDQPKKFFCMNPSSSSSSNCNYIRYIACLFIPLFCLTRHSKASKMYLYNDCQIAVQIIFYLTNFIFFTNTVIIYVSTASLYLFGSILCSLLYRDNNRTDLSQHVIVCTKHILFKYISAQQMGLCRK